MAVGKSEKDDLTYHHAFALFMTYAAIINIPICIYWAGGPRRTFEVLAETDPVAVVLVVIFSVVWGIGTVLFGLACKIAGVGLGTNLSMGLIAIIGAFLPLITEDTLISPAGAVICAGLVICCGGLWLSTKALKMRDLNELRKNSKLRKNTKHENVSIDEGQNDSSEPKEYQYPTWQKISVCLATGICASQLQFAFIFGKEITDLALGKDDSGKEIYGSTAESGGAAIIWLIAITLGAPVAIINALYSSPVPVSSALKTPLSRHLKLILTTSLPWICHIHIYGVCATVLLPNQVASSVGWPMLMMVTTGQALVLSVILGEWKLASDETIRTLKCSVITTVVGIGVLMSSVGLPSNK